MIYGQTFLNEGVVSQIFLVRKIKPKMDIVDAYKKHSYPGLLNMVKNTDNINDLKYLLKDSTTANNQVKIIGARIDKCNKLGNCAETKNYYKGIKSKYIDKGVTSKDMEAYNKWLNEVYKKAIQDKIKELKKGK